jgi:hypothetical protein
VIEKYRGKAPPMILFYIKATKEAAHLVDEWGGEADLLISPATETEEAYAYVDPIVYEQQ